MVNLILIYSAVLGGLFLLSGLLSATETSLIWLGRVRLAQAIERGGKQGEALSAWKKDPNRLLTTILVLNNTVNITATTVATFLGVHLSEILHWDQVQMGTLVAAVVTVIIIVFGEVTPKVLAIHKAQSIALGAIRPLVFIDRMLRPLIQMLVCLTNLFLKPFGVRAGNSVPMVTEEEIHALIQIGADEGVIEDQEHQMIHGVINLSKTLVREVMVPRIEMECINAEDNMEHIIDLIIRTGYSRMPVFRKNVDNIIGVVYTKDIIAIMQNRELIVLQDILRQPYFVPETKKVDELLHEFQRGHIHLAIVVDEYGGTSGMVTMEDLLEEIVGDIRDEYDLLDVEEKEIEKTGENIWRVSAQADLQKINSALEIELPESTDINTVGGYVTDLFGHLPKKGEQVWYQNLQFSILAAGTRKIEKIQIQIFPENKETPPEKM